MTPTEYRTRLAAEDRLARALEGWSTHEVADLCAAIESRAVTPATVRARLDPDAVVEDAAAVVELAGLRREAGR